MGSFFGSFLSPVWDHSRLHFEVILGPLFGSILVHFAYFWDSPKKLDFRLAFIYNVFMYIKPSYIKALYIKASYKGFI